MSEIWIELYIFMLSAGVEDALFSSHGTARQPSGRPRNDFGNTLYFFHTRHETPVAYDPDNCSWYGHWMDFSEKSSPYRYASNGCSLQWHGRRCCSRHFLSRTFQG